MITFIQYILLFIIWCIYLILFYYYSVSVLYSKDNPCLRLYGISGRLNVVSEHWLILVLEYNIWTNSSEIEPVVF